MAAKDQYQEYQERMRKLADLGNLVAIARWDQEVNMPEKGNQFRAQQLGTISTLHHEHATDPEFLKLVDQLASNNDLNFKQKRNLAQTQKDLDKARKLSSDFVYRLSTTTAEAHQSWLKAKEANDFYQFAPMLNKIVDLNLEKAELYGYQDHPYDALMDDFEPELTINEVEPTFEEAKKALKPLYDKIQEKPKPNNDFLFQHFDPEQQTQLNKRIIYDLGYDLQAGRLDFSEHPFTISFGPEDVRITTRLKSNNLAESIWSTIHEAGHGLYEQGLSVEDYGLPSGTTIGLGIHESQSRLYENNLAKSLPFVKAYLPTMQQFFPEQLGNVSVEEFYKGINAVEPSLIRTASDEITYHFHIIIRFEIEKALVEQKIKPQDVREMWNEKYKQYLDIDVPSDREGALQDVHWSHGAIGYFPTYSIGSFYAAQFFNQASKDVPDLNNQITYKEFQPLLSWLRENIHHQGNLYSSHDLCKKVTGAPLNFDHFKNYAYQKYEDLYGISASS